MLNARDGRPRESMYEWDAHVPMAPLPAGFVPWSITRAEWMGQRSRLTWQSVGFATGACAMLIGATMYALLSQGRWAFAFAALWLVGSVSLALLILPIRRMRGALELIWEEHGCVCPRCLVSVREKPCAKHGLGRSAQPTLVRFWVAGATKQMHQVMVANMDLALHARPSRWTTLRLRVARAVAESWNPSRPWWHRSLMSSAFVIVICGPLFAALHWGFGMEWGRMVFYGVFGVLATTIGPCFTTGRSRPRCVRCQQELASPHPMRCPECNASLTADGAVTSVAVPAHRRWKLVVVAVAVSMLPALFMVLSTTDALPPPLAIAMARVVGPSPMLWQRLGQASLTPEQAQSAADLLLEGIEAQPDRRVFDFRFLDSALAAGLLPESYTQRAALAVVEMDLRASVEGDALVAVATPRIVQDLLEQRSTTWVVCLGFAAGDGARTPPSPFALSRASCDQLYRDAVKASMQTQTDAVRAIMQKELDAPVEFVATWPLAALAPGTHEVRVWLAVVVTGAARTPYTPEFDGQGELVPPADTVVNGAIRVYPIERSVTVSVPLR